MTTTDDEARGASGDGSSALAARRRAPGGGRRRPDWSHLARRYAPVLVVALAVGAFVVLRGGGSGSDERRVPAAEVDREQLVRSGPMTAEKAELMGGDPAAVDFGPRCDTETGRIRMPSVYAPPCVERFTGDNGGATSTGVTADAIKLVAYVPGQSGAGQLQQGTLAAAGVERDRREQEAAIRNYVRLYNGLFETYGRRVEVEVYTGTGGPDDEAAAKADAIAIAERRPFAVIGGPDQESATFADELAARQVVCLEGCAVGLDREFLDDHAPYVWLPNITTGRSLLGEAVGKLAGPGPAEMAGDAEMRRRDRVYAVVHYDTPDGFYTRSFEDLRAELADHGIEVVDVPYVLDMNRVQETARTVISRLKASGVTTVVFAGDPITPATLTTEATEQRYFPEWIHGSGYLVDSSLFARTFDAEQWAHGFGLASSVPAAPELETHNQVYEWAFGSQPPNSARVLEPGLRALFIGVHLAGPELMPESFGDGLLRYPPSGGGPTRPRTAYNGVDGGDTALIQWDPDAEGVAGGQEGRGMYRFLRGGERYAPGEIPASPGAAGLSDFGESVVQYSELPPPDRTPNYRPPA